MKTMKLHPGKSLLLGAAALALASSVAISTPKATLNVLESPGQLPSFRQLIDDNVGAVVSIRGSRSGRGASGGAPGMPENIPEPFRRFFAPFPDSPQSPAAAQGSGFIISADGYVLTNAHVVDGANEIVVRLTDNREYPATVVGSDKRSDVALLRVDADNLPAAKLGSSESLRAGDWVLAIGSPFGFDYSVSQGIVSALGRSLPDGTYVPFIQTDVAVNPGNSGGPLFDLNGNVVGINSQIYSRSGGYQGLSFAIPIDLAVNMVEQIKDKGFVSRGWLGVMIQSLNQQLADSFGLESPSGALVSQVLDGSPAAAAGIESGDVILSYDGRRIGRSSDLPPLVGTSAVGDDVAIEVWREGRKLVLETQIAALEDDEAPLKVAASGDTGSKLGVAVSDLDRAQRDRLEINNGVLISEVQPGSPAARAGLRGGDILLSLNREELENVAQLVALLREAPADRPLVLLVKREDGILFVPVQMG